MNKLGFSEFDMRASDTAKAKTINEKGKEVIGGIKDLLVKWNVKNAELISKFEKYLSAETEETN